MADNIQQQLMWCNRARMILASTGGTKQKAVIAFDKELTRVSVKLQTLIDLMGDEAPEVVTLVGKLDQIAVQASGLRDVNDPKYAGKAGGKLLRNEAKLITSGLEALGKDVEKVKPPKGLMEARLRFKTNCDDARKRLNTLKSQEKSAVGEIDELLAFIGKAEQTVRSDKLYMDPAECDKATRVIAEWLGRLSLRLEREARDERQLDEAQSRAKPLAEDQAGTAQRVLAEGLTSGQLTPEMKTKLEQTLQAIELKGAAGLWTDALALCKNLPTAAQCKKAYLANKTSLTSNFATEIGLCDKALLALSAVLESSALEIERASYNRLLSKGAAEGLSKKAITDLQLEMKKLIDGWTLQTTTLTTARDLLVGEIRDLQSRVRRREALVPLPQKAENTRQFELVTSLRDQLLFTAGSQAAGTLARQLTAQRPFVHDGNAWGKAAPGVPEMVTQLDKWAGDDNAAPAEQADAARMSAALSPANIARLATVRDWKSLREIHREARHFLRNAEKNAQKFADFQPERGPLDDAMKLEWAKVEKAIADFEQSAEAAKVDPTPMLSKLRIEYAGVKEVWNDYLKNATRASQSQVKAGKAGVATLLLKIDALDDKTVLGLEAERQTEEKGRLLFKAAQERFVANELRVLQNSDILKSEELKKRMDALAKNDQLDAPGKPWEKRIAGLEQLARDATVATEESRGRLRRLNDTLIQSVASQKERLAQLKKSMKDKKTLDERKFAPLFEGLTADIANLEQLTKTGNLSAAQVNNKLLAQLDRRVQNLQMLVEHGSTFEAYTKDLDRAQGEIDTLRDDKLGDVAPETLKTLKEQIATLKAEIYGMDPTAAGEAGTALKKAIYAARLDLTEIQDQQARLNLAATDCLKRLSVFASQGVAEVYRKALESRVSAARERGATASELPAALRDFAAIQDELSEIEANPEAAYARQKTVLAEQHATLKLKREWESRLSVVKGSVLTRLNTALKSGGDKSQKDEVARMVETAEKAVKDKKDYERGLRLLTQVEGRVAQIERNPEGTALGDRKALPKHVEGFSSNVVKLRQSLDGFVSKSVAKAKDSPHKDKLEAALRGLVDPLTLRLNPGLFASPLRVLLDGEATDAARREAREQALARLRETQGFITTHPVMIKLAENPIAPLSSDMRTLDAALTRLEAHLRAAVN